MYWFLIPLLLGFTLNCFSAFTAAYSYRWGERRGQLISLLLRDVFGIPVWVIGLGMAVRTLSPMFWTSSPVIEALGWLLISVGCVIISFAFLAIGKRAAMPSVGDTLVAHGMYAHIRHPMYGSMFLVFPGMVLLKPSQSTLIACILGIAWVFIQVRLEELDLLQRIPAYREYMGQVPRFVPRLSKKQGT